MEWNTTSKYLQRKKKTFTSSPFPTGNCYIRTTFTTRTSRIVNTLNLSNRPIRRIDSNRYENKFLQFALLLSRVTYLPNCLIWTFSLRVCQDNLIFIRPKYLIFKSNNSQGGDRCKWYQGDDHSNRSSTPDCRGSQCTLICCVIGINTREWVSSARSPWPLLLDNKLYRANRAANSRNRIMTKP